MERVSTNSPFERLASYSRAVRSGNTVAVSGTTSTDASGGARFRGDAYRQTRDAFERALEAAARLGAAREQVVRTRIFLAPGTDWKEAVRAHGDVFRGVNPANTTLFVGGLIPEGSLSEIEIDAAVE